MRSKKGGLISRRRNALSRLEAAYEKFKLAKKDKPAWTVCHKGVKYTHQARSYKQECERYEHEIEVLKKRV